MDPEDWWVFVYRAGQKVEIFDEPEAVFPTPTFTGGMGYQIVDLFRLLKSQGLRFK